MAALATGDPDLGSFVTRLCSTVARLVRAEKVALFLLQPDATLSALPGAYGMPPELVGHLAGIPCTPGGGGIVDQVVHQDQIFRARIDEDAPQAEPYRHWLAELGARDALGVGWGAGSERLGALVAYDSIDPGGFSDDDLWVAQVSAVSAGLVWQQRRVTAQLLAVQSEEMAMTRALADQMTALERTKSDLLNLAAHELRGPLAVIRGYLSMIEEGSLTGPALARVLPTLSGKARQMDFLVTQMLETARLEEGMLKLSPRRIDLRPVVRQVVDTAGLLALPGQWVTFDQPAEPVLVDADPERVATIVANLVDNALKYSPDGGSVTCSVRVGEGTALTVVRDHGLGIAAADLKSLFTRFGRILTPENSHIPGTGLGLHICRSLARMHGGDIGVESSPGEGSTFTLVLPLARD